MKTEQKISSRWALCLLVVALLANSAHAQRQMEPLGRGVVALHSATSQAYIGWRLLATDPTDIGFNLYRSANGAAGVKLNPLPLTNTTDYLDTTATFSVSNSWYVVPVISGAEQSPSVPWGLPANSPVRQYINLPLQTPVTNGLVYDVKFAWVGDFDGDGEYDYLVDRHCTNSAQNQFLQAYSRAGTFLWQMDMGPLSVNTANAYEPDAAAISVGDKDNVTVYDLDGDGRAEVVVRVANGTVLPGGITVTTNNSTSQFLCILDGQTGVERARALIPNPYFTDGPLNCHAGIAYFDGIHPSILFSGENRVGSAAFQRLAIAWDFRNGQLTQRWLYQTPNGQNDSEAHQLRIADVNHDGKDDLIRIGGVVSDSNAVPVTLYSTECAHGDRYHVTDIDPDRPGLEMYSIQQLNQSLLATELQDLGSGVLYKKWYSPGIVDVGRGIALDMNPNVRGCEFYSTQPGTFDCKGNQIWPANLWPPEALWWDADLLREFEDGAGSGALNPVVNKYDLINHTNARIYTIYSEDGGCHQAYGGRAAFWGDIFGDWREEMMLVGNDYSSVRIYTTKIQATNRIYCLMQNPQYRVQCTYKGYYQASYLDYYLGVDMPAIPIPPLSAAQLVWRGDGVNVWDENSTANWLTNNLWISNTISVPFPSGASVLFDLSGSNNTAITLASSLTPGDVRIWSPKAYTFAGPGELTGTMALTKAGAGKVTFSGTNTYTGKTLIGEGAFIVNGALPNSPVTVRGGVWLDGRLGGNGVVGSAVSIQEGGGVSPGTGTNSPGTFTISHNLTLAGRTLNDFDLSDDPTGTAKTNDQLIVTGNLTLTGTNTLVIRKLNATLPPGSVYPLINYSGALSGGLNNLAVSGLPGIPCALTNPPGQIALVIKSYRAPASITWTGGNGSGAWDMLTTTNWLNGAAKDQFAPGDTVRFDATGISNLTATLSGDLICAGIVVDSTTNYTLAGGGAIIGTASLTKTNSGTLTLSAINNSFTGKTTLAGGTLVVSELDAVGYPSPLGSPPGGSTNLVLSGSPTLRVTGESYTDRGLTINPGTNTLEVFNAADQVTIAGVIVGSGVLQKTGGGTLALLANNTYTNQTFIYGGNLSLGGGTANQFGLGNGPGGTGNGTVTISNATLTMFSDTGSFDDTYWNLIVPAGGTATIYADDRVNLHGTLTGGGTLNFNVYYVRTELDGNWSAFTGVINAGTDSGGGDFRIGNANGYGNATVNLADYIYAYHITANAAVSLGAVSGGSLATMSSTAWTVGAKNTNTTYAGKITGSSSITKVGTATWTLTGSNYFTGTTTVSGGTLMMSGDSHSASGNVTVANTATLAGTGLIGGATTIQSGGKLSPGNNAIGTLNFSGSLSFNSGGTAFIEINKTAGTKDLADAGGTLTCGGTLQVTNLSGVLTNGDSFKIFDAATYAGSFTTLSLPPLAANLTWNTSTLTSNGTISVTTVAPTGPQPLTWKGDGVANAWDIASSFTWLNPSNAASAFAQGDTANFNDTGSNNVPVMLTANVQSAALFVNATKDYIFSGIGAVAGTNSLIKSGTGTLTLANSNTFTGGLTISNGTVRVATANLGLAHRWSFNGSPADSVGGQTATLVDVGANNATLTASNVTLAGGTQATSDYISLGGTVFPGGPTPATIELWATPIAIQNWARIFDFGAGTTESLMMSWTRTTTLANDRVEWVDAAGTRTADDTCQPYTLGVEFHIVMVLEPGAGVGGTTRVTWYRSPSTNSSPGAARGTFDSTNTMANLTQPNCWLGRSQWPDNTANASYNEVRIWNRALTTNQLQSLHIAGPNAILETMNLGLAPASLVSTSAVNLAGASAILENSSGQTLTLGSLTGVAGSEARLTSGGLAVGNGTATTFAGFLSGTNGFTKQGAGTLTLSGNSTQTGPTTVGAGTLLVHGNNSAATGALTVSSSATLGGTGTIGGAATILPGATLAPGASIGTINFNSTLGLNGATLMEISHTPLTNDAITMSGAMIFNGALIITNTAGTLAAGDKFKLFNATSYFGSFTSNSLPALAAGLDWNATKLNVSGTLWVVTTNPPTLSPPSTGGGSFSFGGFGGTPGWEYYVITSPDVTLPPASWTRIATNQFDLSGNCAASVPLDPLQPLLFYRVQVP